MTPMYPNTVSCGTESSESYPKYFRRRYLNPCFFFSIADSYNLLGHTSQHINALTQLSLGYGSGMVYNDQQFLNMDQSL